MSEIPLWADIVLLIFLIFLSAFFSATETAYGALNKYQFKVKADGGDKTAKLVLFLYERYNSTLVAILVGNNLFNVAISTISGLAFYDLLSKYLAEEWISLIASLAMAVILYLFGETIPKVVAKRHANRFAAANAYPMAFFYGLFFPLVMLFEGISWLLKKIFRTKDEPEITEEDLSNMVERGNKRGVFEKNEADIIQASLDFADTSVREVFTPVSRMTMLDLKGLSEDNLLSFLRATNYSRIPCYYGEKDRVVGILIVKNYLAEYVQGKHPNLVSTLQKPYIVTPRVMIDDLIQGFRDHKTQIALVMQGNQLLGMVTTEDVLEELVGQINESQAVPPKKGGKKK